jgi:hypothetical protein
MLDNVDTQLINFEEAQAKEVAKPDAGPEAQLKDRLAYGTPFHADVLARLLARLRIAQDAATQRYDAWDQVDEQVRLYVNLQRKAKKGDGTVDPTTMEMPFDRSIVVPTSYAVLMVRLSQLMGILLGRDPMWQLDGRSPDDILPARYMESALSYDMEQSAALLSIYSMMQDAEKYGIGIIYDVWEVEEGWRYQKPTQEYELLKRSATMFGMPGPMPMREWGTRAEYNRWEAIDPYRFWCDPRVPRAYFQTGEFCGHRMARSYLYLLERDLEQGGPYFNLESLPIYQGAEVSYTPKRDSLLASTFNLQGSTDKLDKGYYNLDHLQVKLIPREWQLGTSNIPEIWWFTIANEAVIIRAHPGSYDHSQYTYSIIESNFDNHALYNPGNLENIDGLQRFMNWLLNSHLENIRKHLNDSLIYCPTLIEEDDLLNGGPVRHIRLSQKGEELAMAGVDPKLFVQQLLVADVTKPHLDAFRLMYEMVQLMMATNDPMTGQATQERKTLGEVNQMLTGSSRRMALSFAIYETMGFKPLIVRAIANRQQFSTLEQFFRLVGQPTPGTRMLISPWDLQGNFDYVPRSDILPPDPARTAMVWSQIMLGLGKFPQITAPGPDGKVLDLRAIFNEVAKNLGVKNVEQFYTQAPTPPPVPGMPGAPGAQVMPDEAIQKGVLEGNMIPARMPGIPGMTP